MRIEIIAGVPVMRFKVSGKEDVPRVLEEMKSYGISPRTITEEDRKDFNKIAREFERRKSEK
jgi:hypothetical protein